MSIPEYVDYYDASSSNNDLTINDLIVNPSGTKLYATCQSKVISVKITDLDPSGNNFTLGNVNVSGDVDPSGNTINTIAGSSDTPGVRDGNGINASFNKLFGIAMDTSGNVFVADIENHNIRKIDISGNVTTFAGDISGNPASTDGLGTAARFYRPSYLTIDRSNNIYVTDIQNTRIRKIDSSRNVTTYAGSSTIATGTDTDAQDNGNGTSAKFSTNMGGITCDTSGNIYVTEGNRIRKINANRDVTTLYRNNSANYTNIFFDASRNRLYASDADQYIIQQITSDGSGTILAGSYNKVTRTNPANIGLDLYTDMDILAGFDTPGSMARDATGGFYVLDYNSTNNAPNYIHGYDFQHGFTALRKLRSIAQGPTPILSITALTRTSSSITVTWTGGTYSRNHVFQIKLDGQTTGTAATPTSYNGHLKTATFSGLTSLTNHRVLIRGENTYDSTAFFESGLIATM